MNRIRAARRLAAVLAAALLLTGCSSTLPTSTVPRDGLAVSAQQRQEVDIFPPLPQAGASITEVVQGFLRANVGFADDSDVPRSYLTDELASRWIPTDDILVYEVTPEVDSTNGNEVSMSVRAAGRIGADGRLTEQATNTATVESFELARVGGQWRISRLPEDFGLWLSRTDLEQTMQPTVLYHVPTHGQYFVPDVRWFVSRGEGRPTAVTRAQLGPVPDHLNGAVRQPARGDVRLAVPSVPVDPGTMIATVSLLGSALADGSESADALVAELSHALLGLPGVSGVDVQVAGESLQLAGQDGPVRSSTELPYTDARREADLALLRVGERFTPVAPTPYDLRDLPPDQVADLELPRLSLSFTGVAVTEDVRRFAAVSTDRTSVWRWQDGEAHTNSGIGDGLTAPAVDPQGAFWVGGVSRRSGEPRLWVLDTEALTAVARPVQVDWLTEQDRVDQISISPDGNRALLVLREADQPERLVMSGIVRDGLGRPSALSGPLEIGQGLAEITSARWATPTELYVVGRRAEEQYVRPLSLELGEWLTPLGSREGLAIVEVVPVPSGTGAAPVVRTEDGRVHTREGQGWFDARNGDQLIIPGG